MIKLKNQIEANAAIHIISFFTIHSFHWDDFSVSFYKITTDL